MGDLAARDIIGRLVDELDGLTFDQIVGIPRGGLIVAAALGYRLGMKNVGALTIEYERDRDELAHPTGRVLCAPAIEAGHSMLLVEDGYATGRLIKLGRGWCEERGAKVVTAALRVTRGAADRPDVWVEEVDTLPSGASLLDPVITERASR